MLAYAANGPRYAERRSSPNGMLAIIAAHVALLAAVMSAKMELPPRITHTPIKVDFIHSPTPPPPHVIRPHVTQRPIAFAPDPPPQIVPTGPILDPIPALPGPGELAGPSGSQPQP